MTSSRGKKADPVSPSYHDRTVRAIRRIIRAVDLFSRKLQGLRGVTVPQLSCLLHIVEGNRVTLTEIAKQAELSASTAVGIIDRLERKHLVTRARSDVDRRQVLISPTPEGVALVGAAPSPLQDRLASALDALPELEQAAITLSLERIVSLMGIEDVEASPILDTGASLTADPREDRDDHDQGHDQDQDQHEAPARMTQLEMESSPRSRRLHKASSRARR